MDTKEIEKLVQEAMRNRKSVPDYSKPGPWFCSIALFYDHSTNEWVSFVNRHRELMVRNPDKRKLLHELVDQV